MLTFYDKTTSRDCGGTSRRDFLRIGAAGVVGCSLPQYLAAKANASEAKFLKKKSVVLLFLCGGASHIELFDPKMTAPSDFCCVTGATATALPGVQFGSTYEGMAQRADRMAIVRSFAPHGIADHAKAIKHLLTAGSKAEASIGSRYARYRGPANLETGMPSYCTVIEQAEVDSQYVEDRDRMNIGSRPGELGKKYGPFAPGGGGQLNQDITPNIPLARLKRRRDLLTTLDTLRRTVDQTGTMDGIDAFDRQAMEVIAGGDVLNALDLSREDPRIVERYDTSMFRAGWTTQRKSTLGERLLLARRLCQAGAGFVTVGHAGWDNHANGKHPNVFDGMHLLGRPLDKAVSAFLDDVEQQGLSDDILLVITSEFGRTPKIGPNGGRDHWPGINTLAFAGGGLNMGQVVGESTSKCEEPKHDRVGYEDLLGTIWHALFDVGKLRLQQGVPRELLSELERAKPIRQLV